MAHAAESTHWYTKDGKPMYEVIGKSGYPRPTTLADARKQNLVPSVTTIIRCAAQPGLERWKQEQAILSALTLNQPLLSNYDQQIAAIRADADEQAKKAADRGTEIHAAIERFYEDGSLHPATGALVAVVVTAIDNHFGPVIDWLTEQSFAHKGFGGKADLVSIAAEPAVVIDFKGKDPKDIESGKTLAYDEHCMQLAAYRFGLKRYEARCANVFFSRQEPWLVKVYEWAEADLQRGWEMFQALLDYWYAKTGLEQAA